MMYTMLMMFICALVSQVSLQFLELPRDCEDIHQFGQQTEVYTIYPDRSTGIQVRCDMDTTPGGWTVIQRRVSDTDFNKTWNEYSVGFGDLEDNFWLGNELIHMLSSNGTYQLRIDMSNAANDKRFAIYDDFMVSNAADNYRLTIGSYNGGDAGDSLTYSNGQAFSTKDVDNDSSHMVCAVQFKGAWWYNGCHLANLNGEYGNINFGEGINWQTWEGHEKSLSTVEMKIRKTGNEEM